MVQNRNQSKSKDITQTKVDLEVTIEISSVELEGPPIVITNE